jgi:fatty acid desaturase
MARRIYTEMREDVMTFAELESELASLKAEVDQLRARDERRVTRSRSLVNATTFTSVLFALIFIGFVAAFAWMGRHDWMLWASPILFASIVLNFVNLSLGVWRVEADGTTNR